MSASIKSQAARARCYKCGSPKIKAICHHCGRGMCAEHVGDQIRLPVRLGMWNALLIAWDWKSLDHPDYAGNEPGFARMSLKDEIFAAFGLVKITNLEYRGFVYERPPAPEEGYFKKLGYDWRRLMRKVNLYWGNEVGQEMRVDHGRCLPAHCEFCAHGASRYPALMWIGFALTLTLVGAILGLPLLILGYWLNHSYSIRVQLKQMPALPLEGELGKVRVIEEISGHLELDPSGEYSIQRGEMAGRLTLPVRFDVDARERYHAYMQKFNDLGEQDDSTEQVEIGFLDLGAARREFSAGEIWLPGRVNIVRMFTQRFNSSLVELLDNPDQSEASWELDYTYQLTDIFGAKEWPVHTLPFQIVVAIHPEENRQALDLDLELIDLDLPGVHEATIEEFVLRVPNSLGEVERLQPEGKPGNLNGNTGREPADTRYQTITWKKLKFTSTGKNKRARGKDLRCSMYLQFKNQIDPDARLEGELVLSIPGALSGAGQPRAFYPWGLARQEKVDYEAETRLKLSLDLDLSGLRYQTMKLVPRTITRQGIVPDNQLISGVACILSEQDFYLKRITENPARSSKEGAHKLTHYWDLTGRKYEGVYPVDFHLVFTGEEAGGQGRSRVGQLKVDLTVQGAVTNPEMEAQVQDVCEQLGELIEQALDEIPVLERTPQSLPATALAGEYDGQEGSVATQGMPVEVIQGDAPQVEILKNITPGSELDRLQELQRRLDKLEQRFVDGDIPVDDYHELKIRYEHEIWELTDGQLGKPKNRNSRRQP